MKSPFRITPQIRLSDLQDSCNFVLYHLLIFGLVYFTERTEGACIATLYPKRFRVIVGFNFDGFGNSGERFSNESLGQMAGLWIHS